MAPKGTKLNDFEKAAHHQRKYLALRYKGLRADVNKVMDKHP